MVHTARKQPREVVERRAVSTEVGGATLTQDGSRPAGAPVPSPPVVSPLPVPPSTALDGRFGAGLIATHEDFA